MPYDSLSEFSWSVCPAFILGDDEQTFFMCDSDTMEIDQIVSALPPNKELRLGQIYFLVKINAESASEGNGGIGG
jgi:PADRE domain